MKKKIDICKIIGCNDKKSVYNGNNEVEMMCSRCLRWDGFNKGRCKPFYHITSFNIFNKFYTENKYYSFERQCWETELKILKIFKLYLLTSYNEKTKVKFTKSKKTITEPYTKKPILSLEGARKMFGNNKWTYPLEPYEYNFKFSEI